MLPDECYSRMNSLRITLQRQRKNKFPTFYLSFALKFMNLFFWALLRALHLCSGLVMQNALKLSMFGAWAILSRYRTKWESWFLEKLWNFLLSFPFVRDMKTLSSPGWLLVILLAQETLRYSQNPLPCLFVSFFGFARIPTNFQLNSTWNLSTWCFIYSACLHRNISRRQTYALEFLIYERLYYFRLVLIRICSVVCLACFCWNLKNAREFRVCNVKWIIETKSVSFSACSASLAQQGSRY